MAFVSFGSSSALNKYIPVDYAARGNYSHEQAKRYNTISWLNWYLNPIQSASWYSKAIDDYKLAGEKYKRNLLVCYSESCYVQEKAGYSKTGAINAEQAAELANEFNDYDLANRMYQKAYILYKEAHVVDQAAVMLVKGSQVLQKQYSQQMHLLLEKLDNSIDTNNSSNIISDNDNDKNSSMENQNTIIDSNLENKIVFNQIIDFLIEQQRYESNLKSLDKRTVLSEKNLKKDFELNYDINILQQICLLCLQKKYEKAEEILKKHQEKQDLQENDNSSLKIKLDSYAAAQALIDYFNNENKTQLPKILHEMTGFQYIPISIISFLNDEALNNKDKK